ncbi:ClpX C4-type zinc finger protein [Nonomuraea sp. SBT364]|uniref:ClpX C4-type zinc finger protein n=1 Tax=Nonomuraea sp. SBT364 TaxID=1580530 RepID=UPI00066AFA0D|nr:ClpX C4-type zinc finger protein [Nonomuraea sp. SBT364]
MDSPALNTQAMIEAVATRAASTDALVLLEAAITYGALTGQAADAMVDHYVRTARDAGLSWTDIGERLGISKQAARQRYAPRLEVSGGPGTEPAVIAPRLAACLQAAQQAADAETSAPGTQHLLLGLLQVGRAAGVLDRLGVTHDKVLEAASRLLRPHAAVDAAREVASGGADDGSRTVGDGEAYDTVMRARRFAAGRGQNLARTEHLLFILATDPGCSARRILDDLGVEAAHIKKELADCIPPPPRPGRRGRKLAKPGRAERACSFCGCTDPHRAMVHGPGVQICGECVTLAGEIVTAQHDQADRELQPGRRLIG